jgi:hypothetical protein
VDASKKYKLDAMICQICCVELDPDRLNPINMLFLLFTLLVLTPVTWDMNGLFSSFASMNVAVSAGFGEIDDLVGVEGKPGRGLNGVSSSRNSVHTWGNYCQCPSSTLRSRTFNQRRGDTRQLWLHIARDAFVHVNIIRWWLSMNEPNGWDVKR